MKRGRRKPVKKDPGALPDRNAVGYLANVLIKAAEQGDLEKRIADLESAIQNKAGGSDYPLTGMES